MRKPGGYVTITSPIASKAYLNGRGIVEIEEGTFESDTFQCGHCQRHVHVPPRADPNFISMCRVCMRLICSAEECKKCDPFEKKLEREEARERALKSYGV